MYLFNFEKCSDIASYADGYIQYSADSNTDNFRSRVFLAVAAELFSID